MSDSESDPQPPAVRDSSSRSHNQPTVADVARAAGTSTASVSRVLNAPEKVGPRIKKRVRAAIKKLGYTPNFGARALASRRTSTIGAVVPNIDNISFAQGLQAFQEELNRLGQTLLLAYSSYSASAEEKQIRSLLARGADAVLLIGYQRRAAILRFLAARRVPALAAWIYDAANPQPAVGFDNKKSMRMLAEDVLARGHANIGFISAHCESNDRAQGRAAGVREAMRARGLNPAALKLIETAYSFGNGADAFTQLMAEPNRPTAVMCGNDVLAIGALHAAARMGLNVPDDVSITGFDDIELAEVTQPPLTTVHVPHEKMGALAAHTLVKMVKGEQPASVELETRLCIRKTLGAPPNIK